MKTFASSVAVLCVLLSSLACEGVSARFARPSKHAPPSSFTVGYWVWSGRWSENYVEPSEGWAPDVLYVQAGRVAGSDGAYSWWPAGIPRAPRYWAVWRIETKPDARLAGWLARQFLDVQASARLDGRTLEGIQLDYDCPTGDLARYSEFLDTLSRNLPRGTPISVTALLDWFRPGTDVGQVVARVDEFVPQFYDGGKREEDFAGHIAEPIDAARWAPVFNRFEVPYRIGISTFGRMTTAASGGRAILGDYEALAYLTSDKTQLVGTSRLPTGEFTLKLRVTEGDARHYLGAGETIDAVFATSESVGKAYEAARQMKGYCEGVAFFRWPAEREIMVLSPAAVSRRLAGGAGSARPQVTSADGACASAICSDLYVEPAEPVASAPVVYTIQSSCATNYFLPDPRLASRAALAPGNRIVLKWPAYLGGSHVYVGRAVSHCKANFTIERTR